MSAATVIGKIKVAFHGKTIVSILDYAEKGVYIVNAIPSGSVRDADEWVDTLYSIDKKTLKNPTTFLPMLEESDTYFNLPQECFIYDRRVK